MNIKPSYADIVSSIVVLSVVGFILLSLLDVRGATLEDISATWYAIYSFVLLMSATKLYGEGVYNAVKSVGRGLLGIERENSDGDKSNQ